MMASPPSLAYKMIVQHYFPEIDTGKLCYEWPEDRSAVINTDFEAYSFVSAFCQGMDSSVRIGYRLLAEQRLASATSRDDIILRYCKASKVHDVIRRAVRRFKVRHAGVMGAEQDFSLGAMKDLPDRLKCSVYDAGLGKQFCFRTTDFLRMSMADLTHAPDFIVSPCSIKNPYTNIPFSACQLYHLLAQCRESRIRVPPLLEIYERIGFDLGLLRIRHEPYLRRLAIDGFCRNADVNEKAAYLAGMVKEQYATTHNLSLHEDFPDEAIVNALGHLLKPYLQGRFSLSPDERMVARRLCAGELARFARLNPRFGRGILCRPRPDFSLRSEAEVSAAEVYVFGEGGPERIQGGLRLEFVTHFQRGMRPLTPRSRQPVPIDVPSTAWDRIHDLWVAENPPVDEGGRTSVSDDDEEDDEQDSD